MIRCRATAPVMTSQHRDYDVTTPQATGHRAFKLMKRCGYSMHTHVGGHWTDRMKDLIVSGRAVTLSLDMTEWTVKDAAALGKALGSEACRVRVVTANAIVGARDACLAAIAKGGNTIKALNVAGNKLGSEGAEKFGKVLGKLTLLLNLNISRNNLKSEGAKYLASALGKMPDLLLLHAENNDLDMHSGSFLKAGAPHHCKVKL